MDNRHVNLTFLPKKADKEIKKKLKQINPNVDTNIFRSVHNVNLNTLIGYRKNDIYHNFLDDYDVRKNNNTGANV
jgi:hypothetical protein